jgi:uncharacterized membrane protein YgcG
MKTSQQALILLLALASFLIDCLLFAAAANADQSVHDETGLMSAAAIAQIDATDQQLETATGLMVVVIVIRGQSGASALDSIPTADSFAKDKYGALVWVATDTQQTDIVYVGDASKWISRQDQNALRFELSGTMQFCCPSATVPGIVDKIAAAMDAGSKVPPDPRNYVQDDLGMLGQDQVSAIVARDQQLEATTGKSVAVELFPQAKGQEPTAIAVAIAPTLNVKGQIAAVVWVARSGNQYTFSLLRMPSAMDTIPGADADSINARLQADMQTGKFGDAIVSAVDRTASALESTSTPMPATAGPSALASGGPQTGLAGSASPGAMRLRRGSMTSTETFVIFFIVIVVVFVAVLASRRASKE